MNNVLRCSAAPTWMKCTMSHSIPKLPENESDAAREGTCAAWVAETVINGDATTCDDMMGKVHTNGWEVDEEMVRLIQPYVDMIMSRPARAAEWYGEFEHAGMVLAGTCDAMSHDEDGVFCIDDLKYGHGIVEATSWQLVAYGLIAASSMTNPPEKIRLGIYQPRAIHHEGIYRTVTYTIDEFAVLADQMKEQMRRFGEDHIASPGSQCRNCLGASKCEALTHTVYSMWNHVESRHIAEPNNAELSDELDMLKHKMLPLIKSRIESVSAEIEHRLSQQQFVPGWSIMPKKGRRQFTIDAESIKTITGVDPYDQKVVTPAELERRGASKEVVKSITKTPLVGSELTKSNTKKIATLFNETPVKG